MHYVLMLYYSRLTATCRQYGASIEPAESSHFSREQLVILLYTTQTLTL
jgi:hypothetical protein